MLEPRLAASARAFLSSDLSTARVMFCFIVLHLQFTRKNVCPAESLREAALSGSLPLLRLELVQKFNGALCVGGGLEDRAVVALQRGEPGCDVGSVVVTGPRE